MNLVFDVIGGDIGDRSVDAAYRHRHVCPLDEAVAALNPTERPTGTTIISLGRP